MSNQLIWDNRFNIGVDIIDKEHKKLFKIMNKLFEFSENEDKKIWVCQEGIKYFKDHAIKHFSEEEAYMESVSYENLEMHRRFHEDFRTKIVPALEKELEKTGYSDEAISHFLGVCAGWLIGHTLTEDHAIVGHETSKLSNLRPAEEQIAVKEAILQLLHGMFQLEARVVSECYGGEKFGSGIYYRLCYSTSSGERQEVILIYEEKLLIDTVGRLIGSQSGKLDVMIMNAARYTAMQFAESVRKCTVSGELYQLDSEHLLTCEQFQKVFEKQLPQYSLLFDTGAGYFAYCAMTPRLVKGKNGESIKIENAMIQVQEYLQKTEEEKNGGKKKLLVVDDSNIVRRAIRELLKKDYQVSMAKSGVSAIRSMALERPDLVLLDYNMPVCDGAQVLQMIRSETEFADIPVFFLTGRVDKASVSRVLPLKPDGYLLKSSRPAEIKQNIDQYFACKNAHAAGN